MLSFKKRENILPLHIYISYIFLIKKYLNIGTIFLFENYPTIYQLVNFNHIPTFQLFISLSFYLIYLFTNKKNKINIILNFLKNLSKINIFQNKNRSKTSIKIGFTKDNFPNDWWPAICRKMYCPCVIHRWTYLQIMLSYNIV